MDSKQALRVIREVMGEEGYAEILKRLAGTTVYFPSNTECMDKEERNHILLEDFYSGRYEVGDLARKYDLSVSRVYKIIQSGYRQTES